MPEFIQPEVKTVKLGEVVEFDTGEIPYEEKEKEITYADLEEQFIKMYDKDPDSAWRALMTTIISASFPEEMLEHHGIRGQKWGVRNGPPYPLDEDDHSVKEKNKHWKLSLNNKSDNKPKTAKEKAEIKKIKEQKKYELEKKILRAERKILLSAAVGTAILISPLGQAVLNTTISQINNAKLKYAGKKIVEQYMESEFGKVIYKKGKTVIYGGLKHE